MFQFKYFFHICCQSWVFFKITLAGCTLSHEQDYATQHFFDICPKIFNINLSLWKSFVVSLRKGQ